MKIPNSAEAMAKEISREEKDPADSTASIHSIEEGEVFAVGEDGVDFRTVGWIRAAMFFTKMTFAAGVLSIPLALYTLGAVAGAMLIAFWGGLNTCERFPASFMVQLLIQVFLRYGLFAR